MNIINVGPVLNDVLRGQLNLSFSPDEIKHALWSILNGKAPGMDSYHSKFFKADWRVIRADVISAIQLFFTIGKLLKAWYNTAIT